MKFIYIEGIFINVENIVSVEMVENRDFARTKIITNNSTILTEKYIDEVLDIIENAGDIKNLKSDANDDIRIAYNTYFWAIPARGEYKNKCGKIVEIASIDYVSKTAEDKTGQKYFAETGQANSCDRNKDIEGME